MKKLIYIFTGIMIAASLSSCIMAEKGLTDAQRVKLSKEAELIFEGYPVKVTAVTGSDVANAMESKGDISQLVTFEIDKVVKGSFEKNMFVIAVHSPASSFGLYPWDYNMAKGRKFRIYINYSSEDRTIINSEPITG